MEKEGKNSEFDMSKEVWMWVKGYEGLYKISSEGNILSLNNRGKNQLNNPTKLAKFLKPIHRNRYLSVSLSKEGVSKIYSVHRLVAQAFIPNPKELPEVDHIDRDTKNNKVNNLRWCTHKENMNNENTLRHIKEEIDWEKVNISRMTTAVERHTSWAPKEVFQYTKDGVFINRYESMAKAQEATKTYNIYRVLDKTNRTAGGFIWTSTFLDTILYNEPIQKKCITILKLGADGKIVQKWNSMRKAMKDLKINRYTLLNRIKEGDLVIQ